MDNIRTIGIVGTGVIGASWTAYFLAKGLDVRATDPAQHVGQVYTFKIIEFKDGGKDLVVSRRALLEADQAENAVKVRESIVLGAVMTGRVVSVREFGAFVDLGAGVQGLLHVSEMAWARVSDASQFLSPGQEITVKVLRVDEDGKKISLGLKQLSADPWSTVVEVYPVNSKVKGIVSSVTEYGVFVELEPGVEGLVHVSEISWSRRSQSPKRLFHKGQEVEVQVLGVDTVEKRISLGMKQFQENPWDRINEKYPVGSKVHGRVRNLTDFGAFIEIMPGTDGLLHVSEIAEYRVRDVRDELTEGQQLLVKVINVDPSGKIRLSRKAVLRDERGETGEAGHRWGVGCGPGLELAPAQVA